MKFGVPGSISLSLSTSECSTIAVSLTVARNHPFREKISAMVWRGGQLSTLTTTPIQFGISTLRYTLLHLFYSFNFRILNAISSQEPFNARIADQNSFFDSGDFGLSPIRTAESPSARSVFGQPKSPIFAESVPATPQYYSTGFSPRFSDGPEDYSFDSFGRFDSFSQQDSRFDSFSQRETLARFDSVRSTSEQSRAGFFSFDDPDPFGSTGPFKTTSETPRRTSDQWNAF